MSLIAPHQFPQSQKSAVLASGSAQPSHPSSAPCSPGMSHVNKNAFVGLDLGVPVSPLEPFTSMDPKDYVWGTPSPQQQQHLFQQFMQMAFFCHLAQTANSMASGNQPQPQLPFLPFPFPPFSHMPSAPFPFNPPIAPMQGFHQTPSIPPVTTTPSCSPNDKQSPASSPQPANCVTSESQDNAQCTRPTSPASTTSAVACQAKPAPNAVLDGCEIDCDAIQRLLDDNDICAGHDNLDQVMNFDYMGSPSGSDGSTATGETVLGGGIDSPVSVNGEDTFALGAPGNDLNLSDEEFDAVMKGMNGFAAHSDFTDFDLDDIMTLEEKTSEKSAPGKTSSNASSATQQVIERPSKKSKLPKVQGGVSKITSRSKTSGVVAPPVHTISDFLLS